MNTKKFFMLLAAVLLGSVSAMAQSGNNEPLKGDVNGDSKVDVGDITAVIKIMKENATPQTTYYWYVGTTQPTEENYKTIATEVSSYPETYEYVFPESETGRIYVLIAEGTSIVCQPKGNEFGRCSLTEVTSVNIPGHKVLRTGGIVPGALIRFDTGDAWKRYYLGTTQPTTDNFETLTPLYCSLSEMDGITIHVPSGGKAYFLYPYSSDFDIREALTDDEGNGVGRQSSDANVRFGNFIYGTVFRHWIDELTVERETTLTFKLTNE